MAEPPEAREREDRTVRLEVPARGGYVVLARLALSAISRLTPLPPEDVADLKLAITEAATAFVGEGDEAGPPPAVSVDEPEATLRFSIELADDELVIDVECDQGDDVSGEDGELSRAIIEATVDRWEFGPGTIRLVKRLRRDGN
jgi:serine/threonine-protein kinase RsbW